MSEKSVLPPGGQPVQFTVMGGSYPGGLYLMMKLLASRNICVLGLSVQDLSEVKLVRFVVDDTNETKGAFIESGIFYSMKQVIVLSLPEGPEMVSRVLELLYRCEVIISVMYTLFPHPEDGTLLVLNVDDITFAQGILLAAGFRVMMLEDLCR